MELDDLKTIWKTPEANTIGDEYDRERVMKIIQGSHRSIRRSFTSDIVVTLCLNLIFAITVMIFGGAIQNFLYKLVIVANLVSLPIYYRLYKSVQYLAHFDFGLDIRTSMSAFVDYYKRTLFLYKWATYGMIVGLLVLFSLDESFLALALWIKIMIVAYLLVFLVTAGWLLKKFYGGRIRRIEFYLNT